MEVAREEIYYPEEVVHPPMKSDDQKSAKQKKQKKLQKQYKEKQKKYRIEKALFCIMILMITMVSLGLLLRYVMITEARHEIHQLNSSITDLRNEERSLRVELESLSRSNRVELEAMERLEMVYPEIGEVTYLQVDSGEVKRIANHLESFEPRELPEPGFIQKADESIRQWLSKVQALF